MILNMGPIIGCHPVPRLQLVLSFGHGEIIQDRCCEGRQAVQGDRLPWTEWHWQGDHYQHQAKEALEAANKTFMFFQFPTVSLL